MTTGLLRGCAFGLFLPLAAIAASGALADSTPKPDLLPPALGADVTTYALYDAAEFDTANGTAVHQGRHWHGKLKMDPSLPQNATKEDIWAKMKASLVAAGWTPVFEKPTQPLYGVMHYQKDGKEAWLEVSVYYYGSDNFDEIEAGSQPRTVAIKPPAAKPEKISAKADFPYLPSLPGSKHPRTSHDNSPMTVTLPGSDEPEAVGSGSVTKSYDAPPGMSTLEFVTAYSAPMKKAGWTIVRQTQGIHQTDATITAHYAANGRELWAYLHATPDNYSIQVADLGAASDLAKDLARQCHVALYGVLFDFNKSRLKPESDAVLQRVADILAKSPALKVEVQGHTDNVGSDSYNQTLSEARAKSVVDWLVAHGVATDRLTAKGYGKTRPVADNGTDEGRAKNRRVEIANPDCKAK